ncbi:uncharacterized protein LOC114297800 [Camellia sinensis]|uniref:uncharacterized protein LOC114297800 n=1 Tax=Camellia sinensis TaxID=4442 RepID=UPI001035885C|nr:uncharacterized protein LOC114297800 [Camellia sinensis]
MCAGETPCELLSFSFINAADSDAVSTEWEVESDDESEEESECGLTTLVDMPLNSFPSTVSKETFELKIMAAAKRIYVDVGYTIMSKLCLGCMGWQNSTSSDGAVCFRIQPWFLRVGELTVFAWLAAGGASLCEERFYFILLCLVCFGIWPTCEGCARGYKTDWLLLAFCYLVVWVCSCSSSNLHAAYEHIFWVIFYYD